MSKKVKGIIVGAIILVVLAGVLIFLQITKPNGDPTNSAMSDFNADIIKLFDDVKENLDYIKIENQSGEYTISKQGENLWGITEFNDFPQLEETYAQTIFMASGIVASSLIKEDCQNLDDYGLLNPLAKIETKFKDKDVFKISIGNMSADQTMMYGCLTGQRTVYGFPIASFKNAFLKKYDYIDLAVTPPFDTGNPETVPIINEMTVTRPNLKKPIIISEYTNGEIVQDAAAQANFRLTSPIVSKLNETSVEKWVFGNFGIDSMRVVAVKPTPQQLKEYGIDKPTSTLNIKYNGTSSINLVTGKAINCAHKKDEDLTGHQHKVTSYYVYKKDSDMVYEIAVEKLTWLELKPDNIISKIAVLPNLIDIKDIELIFDGKPVDKIEFALGDDPKDIAGVTAKLNGKSVDDVKAKSFVQLIEFTAIQKISETPSNGKISVSIKYNYRNGKSDLVEITTEKDMSSKIILNKNAYFVGRMGFADVIKTQFQNLIQGKKIDTEW